MVVAREEESARVAVPVEALALWVLEVVDYCEGHVAFGANSSSKIA